MSDESINVNVSFLALRKLSKLFQDEKKILKGKQSCMYCIKLCTHRKEDRKDWTHN